MELTGLVDLRAFFGVVGLFFISAILFKNIPNQGERLLKRGRFCFSICVMVSLANLAMELQKIPEYDELGSILAFSILVTLYGCLVDFCCQFWAPRGGEEVVSANLSVITSQTKHPLTQRMLLREKSIRK